MLTTSALVYMGAPNIDTFKPAAHSIIKVTDFESPKQLAEYLTLLDQNDGKFEFQIEKNMRTNR